MHRILHATIGTALIMGSAARSPAQSVDGGRASGVPLHAPTWTTALECVQCTVFLSPAGNWVEFGTEPVVRGLSASGGVLRDGDVIVAVDGKLVTTRAGSIALAAAVENTTRLTIRRDGKQLDLIVPVPAWITADSVHWSLRSRLGLPTSTVKPNSAAIRLSPPAPSK